MHIPETFPIAAMTAWDIVPEEKPGFCRSQGLRCSKYGVPNGMGMYMCRFIKCSMTTPYMFLFFFFNVLSTRKINRCSMYMVF